MANYKLFSTLRVLREEEFKDFGRWLESPIHNTNVQLVRLFDYLRHYLPQLKDAKALAKERLHKHLYKDEFKEKRIRDLMSLLNKEAESFIAWKAMEKHEAIRSQALAEGLLRRDDYDLFKQATERLDKSLGETSGTGAETAMAQYELLHRLFFHAHTDKSAATTPIFHLMGSRWEYSTALSALHLLCESKIRNLSVADEKRWPFAELIKEHIERNRADFSPLVLFFTDLLSLFKNPDFKIFQDRCHELEFLEKGIHFFDYGIAAKMLLNFANLQLRNGQSEYLPHLLKLHECTLDAQLRYTGPQLSTVRFSNIVIHSVLDRQFDWVKNFIEKYQIYLPEGKEDPAVNFAYTYWHFHYGWFTGEEIHYSKAYEYVIKLNYTNPLFDIRLRGIELRIGFECLNRETDEAWIINRITLFKRYLRQREDIPDHHKRGYTHFVHFFGQMFHARNSKIQLLQVYDTIRETPPFVLQQWLENRIEKLLNQFR